MTSAREDLLGTVLAGRYELTEVIGEGGMGTVFRAHQLGVGRDVAIKILNPVPLDDYEHVAGLFFREARAICQLSHPNTIRLFDFGRTSENELYITMELVTGKSLSELIREGALELFEAVHIGQQLAEALMEAHDQGIIHRDIKPDNVLVEDKVWNKRFSKILDFGIARVIGQTSESQSPTLRFGTPLYMSPEQILGKTSDARTDIYMLGALLFECLTGHPPYIAKTAVDVCLKHLEAPVPALVRWDSPWMYPPRLVTLVQSMLAKEQEDRPHSARYVAEELQRIASEESVEDKTSIIPSEMAEDTASRPSDTAPEAPNPRLRMSQSIELTDDFGKQLGDWQDLKLKKPDIKRDLTMTPQARDPRDLITRISAFPSISAPDVDPFEFLDKAEKPLAKAKESVTGPKHESQAPVSPQRKKGEAPSWIFPLLGVLVMVWLTLIYFYFFPPA